METVTLPKPSYRKTKIKKSLSPLQLVEMISQFLDGRKAIDLITLPLEGKSSIADYLVICSGSSQRHISSMAEDLALLLKNECAIHSLAEGLSQSDWVLLDAGDVIVHLFRPEVRTFYNLEKMWDFSADDAREADATY